MQLDTVIQTSYSQRYQDMAIADFKAADKNIFSKRVCGVVKMPLACLADMFKCLFLAAKEFGLIARDRDNARLHRDNAVNYIAFAAYFWGQSISAPTVNMFNPQVFRAPVDAVKEQAMDLENPPTDSGNDLPPADNVKQQNALLALAKTVTKFADDFLTL